MGVFEALSSQLHPAYSKWDYLEEALQDERAHHDRSRCLESKNVSNQAAMQGFCSVMERVGLAVCYDTLVFTTKRSPLLIFAPIDLLSGRFLL